MSPESLKRGELTQHLLDVACAKASELGLDNDADLLISAITLAMHLSVDRKQGDVAAGLGDIVIIAELCAAQMREWPLYDRLLDREAIN